MEQKLLGGILEAHSRGLNQVWKPLWQILAATAF